MSNDGDRSVEGLTTLSENFKAMVWILCLTLTGAKASAETLQFQSASLLSDRAIELKVELKEARTPLIFNADLPEGSTRAGEWAADFNEYSDYITAVIGQIGSSERHLFILKRAQNSQYMALNSAGESILSRSPSFDRDFEKALTWLHESSYAWDYATVFRTFIGYIGTLDPQADRIAQFVRAVEQNALEKAPGDEPAPASVQRNYDGITDAYNGQYFVRPSSADFRLRNRRH